MEQDILTLYEDWYQSSQGNFALNAILNLTNKMISPWPRRGHKALLISYDNIKSIDLLWQSGFDVSAIATSHALALNADPSLKHKADIHYLAPMALGNLPFNDKSFDYTIINLSPIAKEHTYPHIQDIIYEAMRVSVKSILLQSWNTFSIAHWQRKNSPLFIQHCPWFTGREIYNILRKAYPSGQVYTKSTLLGSVKNWGRLGYYNKINQAIIPLALGAFMQVRLDLTKNIAMTTTPLLVNPLTSPSMQPISLTTERIKS